MGGYEAEDGKGFFPRHPVLSSRPVRLLDPATRKILRERAEALRARVRQEAQRTRPALEQDLAKIDRKIANLVEHLTELPPHAAQSVREKLEDFSQQRERLQGQLRDADRVVRATDLLLLALGGSRYRLLIPTSDPGKRGRILGRAAERILTDLQASSPEAVRRRLQALIREVTIHAVRRVTVEGTWEPLVTEEMKQAGQALTASAEKVREMLVPGERYLYTAHSPDWQALLTWREELPAGR